MVTHGRAAVAGVAAGGGDAGPSPWFRIDWSGALRSRCAYLATECGLLRAPRQTGGIHVGTIVPQTHRRARRAGPVVGPHVGRGAGANQGHHRRRRRRVPVLSADRAGQAARRIRKGRRRGRTGRFQGRLAVAEGRARRLAPTWCPAISTIASISPPRSRRLQAFVVYDRYPGFALVVSPKHTDKIKSIKDLAGKKVGVSAPARRPTSS